MMGIIKIKFRQILLWLVFSVILIALFRPVNIDINHYPSTSSHNYQESVLRIRESLLRDGPQVVDYCHPIFLTHGEKMKRAVVMYHGYTNCPRQYEKLAKMFFERGYNVYVPRIPHHGYQDLLTKDIGKLSAEELVQVCQESIDIAQGLGDEVTVLGLSMGGVMASWGAQFRDDVDTAVVIAPSFAWYFLPRVVQPLMSFSLNLPQVYLWWDPLKREKRIAPYSMYYKFSSRGMGQVLRMGVSVLKAAQRQKPHSGRIIVMTNSSDVAVDEWTTRYLIDQWRGRGADVMHYVFPKSLGIEHDIIDPLQLYEKTDDVYSKIFEMIHEE